MNNTTPTVEAKIAKFIYKNLAVNVVRASTHPLLCKLNLHNSTILKKINAKAGIVYKMAYNEDELVKESFDCGGSDDAENALLTILSLVRSNKHENHKEYIFKRIDYLASVALSSIYDRNHAEWVQRIHEAIHSARNVINKKPKTTKITKSKKTPVSKKTVKTKTSAKPLRNKKGQFVKARRRRS